MSLHHVPAAMPGDRFRQVVRRIATTIPRWIAAPLPPSRREGHVIGFVGLVIVLFITAFTGLILRHIEEASRNSDRQRVEQLLNSITYQLATSLVIAEQAMRHTGEEIRRFNDPQRLAEVGQSGLMPTLLIDGFLFIDRKGQVVASVGPNSAASKGLDLSDRDYFRAYLGTLGSESRIGRPIRNLLTGNDLLPISHPVRQASGELIGVLVAMIDLQALERIWVDIGLTADDTVRLIGEDNTDWFRWPHRRDSDNADAGSMSWSRAVATWPIRIVASLDPATTERHTVAARRAIVASAGVGALMVVLFCFLLAHHARQATRERDAGDAVRARLLVAINAVPVEFVEYDGDGRLIVANQAARDASPWRLQGAATGKSIGEIMESYAAHFQTADTAAAWKAWTDQTIADFERGGVADSRRPDGQWRRSYVTRVPGGGRVVVRVDLSEIKLQEQKLTAEMERLSSIFQSKGASILMLDRDARVVMANQLMLDLNGTSAAEIVGRPYSGLTTNGLDPAVIAQWQMASGGTRLRAAKFESAASPGSTRRSIRVTANPIQDEAGRLRYIVLIGVDDTERRMAEIRLFEAARLDHLGEMATGMAHEINQPLAVIRMAAESLCEELDTPESAATPPALLALMKSKLDRICKQVERASGLVRNLRTIARVPTGVSAPFDLVEAVRVGGGLLREQLKAARIDLRVDLAAAGPTVRGEASQLQQVMISLVLNARDALLAAAVRPPSGTLGHITIRVAAAPTGGGMELVVEDDGPGIAEAVLPRVFEPFFTTKATGKGAGLGLSISYGIIQRIGGKITAENRKEGGARFRIAFPPVLDAASAEAARHSLKCA